MSFSISKRVADFLFVAAVLIIALPAVAASDDTGGEAIYAKPYLGPNAVQVSIGGYLDHEFEWVRDGGNTFDQHRFVPFITAQVSDRVRVSSEIEFEHGGLVKGSGDTDGEVKIEYAVLDFSMSEALNFRGGVILSPLGAFNVRHDTPLNDLTARPVVTRQLIPSTLSESGMGFFGSFFPGEADRLDYEIYLVNGFDAGILADDELRVRGGRGSQKKDNNENKAVVGRIGYSPDLGYEFGASVHSGVYDSAGDLNLTIAALDARVLLGDLDLQGEFASVAADIDRDLNPAAAESQRGAYFQAGWHLWRDAVLDGSVFTLVGRGDWVDFDSDLDGDHEQGLTLGLNFRPTEETVFKLDYNWTWETPVDGEAGRPYNRLFFSFASYF